MRLLRRLGIIFDYLISSLGSLAGVLLILVTLTITTDVVMRYFLNRPIVWVLEVSEYSLLFITFLGAAWVLKREKHVKMDLVLNRLQPKPQAALNTITSIISAIVMLIVVVYTARATWEYFKIGYFLPTQLKTPLYLILAIIPIGSLLLTIQFLRRALSYLTVWQSHENLNSNK